MKASFFQHKFDSEPEGADIAFEDLPGLLRELASDDKDTAPLWSPAEMVGGKTEGHTKTVGALALDFDGHEPPWSALEGFQYFAHTTHSHMTVCEKNPDGTLPFWRVLVALEGDIPAAEWKERFKLKCAEQNWPCDPKCCNPNRSFFVPPAGAEWRENDGLAARMPVPGPRSAKDELTDLDANQDGLASDGRAFWPAVERMMRSLPPSVAGQGGDDRLFEAACVCRKSFRLTPEASMEALRIFNERCNPPWDEGRLAYKIQQASRDTQHKAGELIPPDVRKQLVREAAAVDPVLAAKVEAEQMEGWIDVATDTPEALRVDWVCEGLGITPGRPCMLYADPHAGKTTVQAELALAFATGTRAFRDSNGQGGIDVGPARRVVCLECEDDFDLRHHIGNFKGDRQLGAGMLVVSARPIFHDSAEILEAIFSDLAGKGIIFLNSLRAFTPGLEENSSDFAAPLLMLAGFSRKYGVPVWINHHTNKAGGVRGTSAIAAAAGNSWTLTNEDGQRIMTHSAARMCKAKQPFGLRQEPHALVMTKVESKEHREQAKDQRDRSAAIEQAKAKILEALKAQRRWMKRSDLIDGMKADIGTEALRQLRVAIPAVVGHKKDGKSDLYHVDPKLTPTS